MAVTSLLSFTLSAGMVALSPVLSGISVNGSWMSSRYPPFSSVTVCLPPFFIFKGDIHSEYRLLLSPAAQQKQNHHPLRFLIPVPTAPLLSLRSLPAAHGHWCYLPGL